MWFKLARGVFAVKFVSDTLLWTPVSPTVSSRRGERLAAFVDAVRALAN